MARVTGRVMKLLIVTVMVPLLQLSSAFKLVNYGDLLAEVPSLAARGAGVGLPSVAALRSSAGRQQEVRSKSVAELLEMSHNLEYFSLDTEPEYDPYYTKQFDPYPLPDLGSLGDYGDTEVLYTIEDVEVLEPESIEGRLGRMLGEDFFEDRKFVLFLVLSLLLLLVLTCGAGLAAWWCCRRGCGGRRAAPPPRPASTPCTSPSPSPSPTPAPPTPPRAATRTTRTGTPATPRTRSSCRAENFIPEYCKHIYNLSSHFCVEIQDI